jgi:hypothetical protein
MAFDDERTCATLRALQELSRKTHVLVFAHHEHHVGMRRYFSAVDNQLRRLEISVSLVGARGGRAYRSKPSPDARSSFMRAIAVLSPL